MVRVKRPLHLKRCRRCGKVFRTELKFATVCFDCNRYFKKLVNPKLKEYWEMKYERNK